MSTHLPWKGSRTRRAVLGTSVLLVLVGGAALIALLSRADRPARVATEVPTRTAAFPSSPGPASSAPPNPPRIGPPSTHDPIAFAKAAAVALWSYDSRKGSRNESLAALHRWLTGEKQYADASSVDALVPSPVLWREMAAHGQFATATVAEGYFPASFTQALRQDPGAIATAYVYAVTVTGEQSIGWKGALHGGAEPRSVTLAVQCRPGHDCALAGVLPNVAP